MEKTLYQTIADELKLGSIQSIEEIHQLWSGYGALVRLNCHLKSVIVKHIKLNDEVIHPKGWNTNRSHKRKLHSYKVEVNWYESFSHIADQRCLVPKGLMTFHTSNESLIVMEDLASIGLGYTVKDANEEHLKNCLSWLANFHARFINTKSSLLWESGTYWHLETRPDELEVLEDEVLKSYASKIDEQLKQVKYQTLVHGDAKLANFCFNKEGTQCAAVDFQYVGHGCAMKDVAYFMSSAIEPEKCELMQSWILDSYFEALQSALSYYQPNLDFKDVEQAWRPKFALAWADFQRFIKGWSPNHYKINQYSEALTQQAIKTLKVLEKNS